uniref:Uncharacterized protein n=1 Tax=Arthrobacter sp. J3.40 TaxID=347209 RepID=I3W168_9MICC|nr:hypothetical protein [Arthrobacter sp. J3.40]
MPKGLVGGAAQVTGQRPLSPVDFWLLAKLAELCPCRPVYP